MNALIRLSAATVLALAMGLGTGCPPKDNNALSEEQALDPAANFQSGVTILQNTTRVGGVDYATAYDRFLKAEQLGAGKKASFNAGYVAEMLGRMEDAAAHYQRAVEADPSYEAAVYSYGRVLAALERHADAVTLFEAFSAARPDDLDARNEYLLSLGRAGRYEEAERVAGEILLADPENVQTYRSLSSMYQAKGDFGMARLTADKAASLMETRDPGLLNNEGVAALLQGDEPGAIALFKEALALHPTNFEANLNLGFIALNSGDYALAMETLSKATQADPTSLDAKLGLAVAYRGMSDYDRADALYAEIIRADRTYDVAYFNAATLHEKYTRNYNKAIKYLEQYIDVHAGQLASDDPVYAAMERVRSSRAAEEARAAELAERRRLEEERRQRNAELLASMASAVSGYQAKFAANSACLDEGMKMEGEMILEQAQMVVEAQDADLAADIQMLLDGYTPLWDEAIAGCEGGAPPAPEEPAPE